MIILGKGAFLLDDDLDEDVDDGYEVGDWGEFMKLVLLLMLVRFFLNWPDDEDDGFDIVFYLRVRRYLFFSFI